MKRYVLAAMLCLGGTAAHASETAVAQEPSILEKLAAAVLDQEPPKTDIRPLEDRQVPVVKPNSWWGSCNTDSPLPICHEN